MKKRMMARLAWTGIASPLLMLLAYEMDGTRFGAIALPFSAPGLLIASIVLRLMGNTGNAELALQVAFGLNFVFVWVAVLIVLNLIENFIARWKAKPAN